MKFMAMITLLTFIYFTSSEATISSLSSNVAFEFGVKTTYDINCRSYDSHTMTLYWDLFLDGAKMYQCEFTPYSYNTLYTCDSSTYTECDASDSPLDYGMQISINEDEYPDDSCFQQLYIKKIDTESGDILDTIEIAINNDEFGDDYYSEWHRLYEIDPFTRTATVNDLPQSSPICGTVIPLDEEPTYPDIDYLFEFGFKTCDDEGSWTHTITLYFGTEMLQCLFTPSDTDTLYTCDTTQYTRCNNPSQDLQFKLDIEADGSSGACIAELYIKVMDIDENLVKVLSLNVNNEKAKEIGVGGYGGRIYTVNPEWGEGFIVSGTTYDAAAPVCDALVSIKVESCDNFNYGSISNALQMQFRGSEGMTQFFYVNRRSILPKNGEYHIYTFNDINPYDIGSLYTAVISVDDAYGYCIAAVTVTLGDDTFEFDDDGYFGSGVILSNKCDYSYRFLSSDSPLISCIDENFELNTYSARSIFELLAHSCINDESGISAVNMKDNLYVSIMGKEKSHNKYISAMTKLDHYVPGDVSIQSLGHLIAGNADIDRWHTNPISLYSEISGTIIGIRIESVDYYTKQIIAPSELTVKIDNNLLPIFKYSVFDNARYLIAFFDELNISPTSQINVEGDIFNGDFFTQHYVNLYFIFDGYNDEYQLPFYIEESEGINWFDANTECYNKYGTNLASIHSEEEEFLLTAFRGSDSLGGAWFGLFDLTVEEANNWKWIDGSYVDYTNWAEGKPDELWLDSVRQDCANIWSNDDGWDDAVCSDQMSYYICANPFWFKNRNRKFEINVNQYMDEVTVVSIGINNNIDDNLCIDAVSINHESSLYISNNWIGTNSALSLQAIFKYPVCKTEVIAITIDYDSSTTNILNQDSTITGLQCKNNNRLITTTCSISQAYQLTKATSFAISNEDSSTDEYSWGSSSSTTTGTTEGTTDITSSTTSNEFSWGLGQEMLGLSSNQQWTETEEVTEGTETSTETSTGSTSETNAENTASTEYTNAYESSFETSSTTSIECSGEVDVPPSHIMEYNLIFSAFNTTIKTSTDLKLTLCSAFFGNNAGVEDEAHYVYIDNIPGVLEHKETTQCAVEFTAAEYIRNDVKCDEEMKLAFAAGSNYVPRCKSSDSSLYDGCQCDTGDSLTLAQCFCSDNEGNMLEGKLAYVPDGESDAKVCVDDLQCTDSDVTYSAPKCDESQKVAIVERSTYLPRCLSTDSTLYDGCQCDIRDLGKLGKCWCVDSLGNKLDDKAMEIPEHEEYQKVCVEDLQCGNSEVVYSVQSPSSNVISLNVLIGGIVVILVLVCFVLYRNLGDKHTSYSAVYVKQMDYEFDEEDPLNA